MQSSLYQDALGQQSQCPTNTTNRLAANLDKLNIAMKQKAHYAAGKANAVIISNSLMRSFDRPLATTSNQHCTVAALKLLSTNNIQLASLTVPSHIPVSPHLSPLIIRLQITKYKTGEPKCLIKCQPRTGKTLPRHRTHVQPRHTPPIVLRRPYAWKMMYQLPVAAS